MNDQTQTSQPSAHIKITLKSSTGLKSTTEANITPEQWGDINAVIEGKLKSVKSDEA